MEIKTKYNIHDKVTIQDYVTTYTDCPVCETKGTITVKNINFECPYCLGRKTIKKDIKKSMTVEITNIIISINNNGNVEIKYISDYSDWGPENYHIFYEKSIDK